MDTNGPIKKVISLRLDLRLYQKIQKLAKEQNKSVNSYIGTLLSEVLAYNKLNEATQKAIEEARKEEKNGVLKSIDLQNLWEEI